MKVLTYHFWGQQWYKACSDSNHGPAHFRYMPILSQWQCSADEVYYQHVMTRDTFVPKPFSSQLLQQSNTGRNFTFTSTLWDANKQGVVRSFCEEWIGLKCSPVLVVGILSSWLDQCDSCHPLLLLLLPPLAWVQLSPWQPHSQNLLKRVQNFLDQLCFLGSSPSNANALAQLSCSCCWPQLVWRRLSLTPSHCCCCCTATSISSPPVWMILLPPNQSLRLLTQ